MSYINSKELSLEIKSNIKMCSIYSELSKHPIKTYFSTSNSNCEFKEHFHKSNWLFYSEKTYKN